MLFTRRTPGPAAALGRSPTERQFLLCRAVSTGPRPPFSSQYGQQQQLPQQRGGYGAAQPARHGVALPPRPAGTFSATVGLARPVVAPPPVPPLPGTPAVPSKGAMPAGAAAGVITSTGPRPVATDPTAAAKAAALKAVNAAAAATASGSYRAPFGTPPATAQGRSFGFGPAAGAGARPAAARPAAPSPAATTTRPSPTATGRMDLAANAAGGQAPATRAASPSAATAAVSPSPPNFAAQAAAAAKAAPVVPNFAAAAAASAAPAAPAVATRAGAAATAAAAAAAAPNLARAAQMRQAAMFLSGDDRRQAQAIAEEAAGGAAGGAGAGAGAAGRPAAPGAGAGAGRVRPQQKGPFRLAGANTATAAAAATASASVQPLAPHLAIQESSLRLAKFGTVKQQGGTQGALANALGFGQFSRVPLGSAHGFKAAFPGAAMGMGSAAPGTHPPLQHFGMSGGVGFGPRRPALHVGGDAANLQAADGAGAAAEDALAAFTAMRRNFAALRIQRQNKAVKQQMRGGAGAGSGAAPVFGRGPAGAQSRFPGAGRAESEAAAAKQRAAAEVAAALAKARTGGRRTGMFGAAGAGGAGGGRGAFGKTAALRAALKRVGAAGRVVQSKRVIIRDDMTVRDLAEACGVKPGRMLAKLADLGESAKVGDAIDPDVAEIVVGELGHRVKRTDSKVKDRMPTDIPDPDAAAAKGLPHRAPVVTVMGHVDHGKTTLLDALRGTSVAEREAGGITQGVAAFSVAMRAKATAVGDRRAPGGKAPKAQAKGKDSKGSAIVDGEEPGEEAEAAAALAAAGSASSSSSSSTASAALPPTSHVDVMTFLDTPGHALFSSMRQRGAALTDIVVLVVDGKDGVMPQTKECVETILREMVPVVVAVTKCDLVERTAAVDNIARQLLELGLATDAYGGDAIAIPVSAKTGEGLQELKEAIALQAEVLDLRAAADEGTPGEATVIDGRMVKGSGLIVDAVVRWGKLKVGDVVVCGEEFGKVKALQTDAVGAASLNVRLAATPGGAVAGDDDSDSDSDEEGGAAGGAGNGNVGKKSKKDKKKDKKSKDKNGKKDKNGGGKRAARGGGDDDDGGSVASSDASGGAGAGVGPAAIAASAGFSLAAVEAALPGTPVRVLGLKGVPDAGDFLLVVADEEAAKAVVDIRRRRREAQELLRVAAADAVRRSAERAEYTRLRERRAAYKAAMDREGTRRRLRKAGAPLPPDLELQPWEAMVLKEFSEGKIAGAGKRGAATSRVQGGQQADVTVSYAAAAAAADASAASGDGGAAEGGAGAAAAAALAKGPVPVPFVVKSDSAASLVALADALARIGEQVPEVLPRVVMSGVGEVTEKDVQQAADMGARILAFNAKIAAPVAKAAERKKVPIVSGRVIYHVLDAACDACAAVLDPVVTEEVAAVAEVRQAFDMNASKKGDPQRVAGCTIAEGTFAKAGVALFRVLRGVGDEAVVVHEARELLALMHFKDKVESVKKGSECGISLPAFNDFAPGDRIVAVRVKSAPRKLDVKFD